MSGTLWGGDTRPPAEQERSKLIDADIIDLRRKNVQFEEIGRIIAEKWGRTDGREGPFSKQAMQQRWKAAIEAAPARKIMAHRAELSERLEGFLERVETIMRKDHLAHSNGRVVTTPDGQPVLDDGPKLAALAEARKIVAEIRQLNGLTLPVKQELEVAAQVNYTVNGVDVSKMT